MVFRISQAKYKRIIQLYTSCV